MIATLEFRRFIAHTAESLKSTRKRFIFFLGAGCSVSSGVLPASTLSLKWARELWRQEQGFSKKPNTARSAIDVEAWYKEKLPNFDAHRAGEFYSDVFTDRYPTIGMRRSEVMKFTSSLQPNLGYALLASLMTDDNIAGSASTVITTNFDDLLNDALRRFYATRAMVIPHESLIDYASLSRETPVIVKLHGDAMFDPLNIRDELEVLNKAVQQGLSHLIRGTSIIFLGYSGGDEGVASALERTGAIRGDGDVYWVNKYLPNQRRLMQWLESRRAIWVEYSDFDVTMLALAKELKLPDPTAALKPEEALRYEAAKHINERKLYKFLNGNQRGRLRSKLPSIAKTAQQLGASERLHILKEAVSSNTRDAPLIGFYAQQLSRNGNYFDADKMYNMSLEVDPDNIDNICHYAGFIVDHELYGRPREDRIKAAEIMLWKATLIEPRSPRALGSYASFMWTRRRNAEQAENYFQRALQCDPWDAETLSSYGNFVWRASGAQEEAIAYYSYALEKRPSSFRLLANSAQILFSAERKGQACDYARAVLRNERSSPTLKLESAFYLYALDTEYKNFDYLVQIRNLLMDGVRSLDWDLRPTIEKAVSEGRQKFLLHALSGVISDNENIADLDEFSAWIDLGAPGMN